MNSKQSLKIAAFSLYILTAAVWWPMTASALTTGEITNSFACTCGCNMVVSACGGSMECAAASNISQETDRLIGEGNSRTQIIKYFTAKYGERILAAPTKKGFNLTAWILPFVALLVGGLIIYLFIYRCLKTRRIETAVQGEIGTASREEKEYLARLEKELLDFKS